MTHLLFDVELARSILEKIVAGKRADPENESHTCEDRSFDGTVPGQQAKCEENGGRCAAARTSVTRRAAGGARSRLQWVCVSSDGTGFSEGPGTARVGAPSVIVSPWCWGCLRRAERRVTCL